MPKPQKRYVGLDVHEDVVEYCILDLEGKKLDEGNFSCERSAFMNFATKILAPGDHVALVSTTSIWTVVDIFEPFAEKIVVGDPRKTRAIAEAKIKPDTNVAMVLAKLLCADLLPTVRIPDKKTRERRQIASFRKFLAQRVAAAKNEIKDVLNRRMINHTVSWTKSGLEELKKLELPPVERMIMNMSIATLEHLEREIEKYETEIASVTMQPR